MGTGALLLLLFGAGDEARTRYLHLGKVALYQMSYARMKRAVRTARWCLRSESNQRHEDFQSSALPTELQRHFFLLKEQADKMPAFQKKVSGDSEGT